MADVPHFSYPFRRTSNGKTTVVTEQDMDDEIMDCVEILLLTERGERIELPDYGVPDQTFTQGGANMAQIRAIIGDWEPRAPAVLTRESLEDLVDRVRIEIREQGG